MATDDKGMNPIDRLRDHYDNLDMTCPACGYDDADGKWDSETDGHEITYEHRCPSCGERQDRTITVENDDER